MWKAEAITKKKGVEILTIAEPEDKKSLSNTHICIEPPTPPGDCLLGTIKSF